MWSNVLERSQNSFTKTLTKPLWYDVNLVKHTNSLLNASEAKCRQQGRLTFCLKSLPQSLECWIRTCLYQKHWEKPIPSKITIFSNFLSSTGKKLNGRRVSMGIFPDDLEGVYDLVIKQTLRQTGLEEASPKLIKYWLEQRKVVSQSFYVSSGVALSGNNDLWRILFCESFRPRRIRW